MDMEEPFGPGGNTLSAGNYLARVVAINDLSQETTVSEDVSFVIA
jgi:hypothetical protein